MVVGDVCWLCVILLSSQHQRSLPRMPTHGTYVNAFSGEHWVLQAQTQASAQPTDLRVQLLLSLQPYFLTHLPVSQGPCTPHLPWQNKQTKL